MGYKSIIKDNPMKRIKDKADYLRCCAAALEHPENYWSEVAKSFDWIKLWDRATPKSLENFENIEWFKGAKLNITQNALDRHVKSSPNKIAIYFEPNSSTDNSKRSYTYKELYLEVCRMAETLRSHGVKKGDTVTLYMGMNPQLLISTLACARIGAIHSVVFGGFSANALSERVSNAKSKIIITQEVVSRGDKKLYLNKIVDEALGLLSDSEGIKKIVYGSNELELFWKQNNLHLGMDSAVEVMDSEDPLFILYTSGSTGKPKGLLHTTAGYMVWAQYTFEQVFGVDKDKDVFWCTADIGWITGHSYFTYGPLLAGVSQVMYEGIPTYPDAARWWKIIDEYKVSHFYTAPTAIRSLESLGTEWFKNVSLDTLKVLGSVGEPINVEAWEWYNQHVGKNRCPIVDTWWQTETGGIMISSLANVTECIPTMATYPLPGIYPALMDDKVKICSSMESSGNLVITRAWPGMARTIWGDHARYQQSYFSTYEGKYFTGDGSNCDAQGRYRITGRVDDVLNVSGHRLSTAEIENAINEAEAIVESAVVGMPHAIKGQAVLAYVLLSPESKSSTTDQELLKVSNEIITKKIGPIAKLDKLVILTQLPKTRSGKIMRRILRKGAEGEWGSLGDTSTLLNPEVVEELKIKLQGKV
jgi:acetyl-CoA synthetase